MFSAGAPPGGGVGTSPASAHKVVGPTWNGYRNGDPANPTAGMVALLRVECDKELTTPRACAVIRTGDSRAGHRLLEGREKRRARRRGKERRTGSGAAAQGRGAGGPVHSHRPRRQDDFVG